MEKNEIITLYISFKDDSKGWLNLHRQHFTQFVTIILAVLAVSIGAFYQFRNEGWLLLLISFGFFFNAWISCVAIKVCDRFYQRFLEHETIADKLYFLLDKVYKIDPQIKANVNIFQGDSHLFPKRWLDSIKNYKTKTSDKFVKDKMKEGSNRFIRCTFKTLAIANIVIAIISLLSLS